MVATAMTCYDAAAAEIGRTDTQAKRVFWCGACGAVAFSAAPTAGDVLLHQWCVPTRDRATKPL